MPAANGSVASKRPITPSEPARQSNFEKSAIFRWTVVAALLFIVVNAFQDAPIDAPATAYRVTV